MIAHNFRMDYVHNAHGTLGPFDPFVPVSRFPIALRESLKSDPRSAMSRHESTEPICGFFVWGGTHGRSWVFYSASKFGFSSKSRSLSLRPTDPQCCD